ncbi:MAG: DUF111 family protein, partial [Nitrospirae bacterium]|nr:DUF111 family protein [Nitrospirota bacterium]
MAAAYIQCTSGVSGDMLVAALLDAGVPIEYLRQRLSLLSKHRELEPFETTARAVFKNGFRAIKFDVKTSASHVHRNWQEIKDIIDAAG